MHLQLDMSFVRNDVQLNAHLSDVVSVAQTSAAEINLD